MSNLILYYFDYITANGHGNMKKKKVGIAVGVIIFGLIACVSIMIIKNPGKLYYGYNLLFATGTQKRGEKKRCQFYVS